MNRRRVMGGCGENPYDEFGYIKAGKVFHLDGINKGNDATAWTDLVGGMSFPWSGDCVIENNGVVNCRLASVGIVDNYDTLTSTIEAVSSNNNTSAFPIILSSPTVGGVVLSVGTKITYGSKTARVCNTSEDIATTSASWNTIMQNGQLLSWNGTDTCGIFDGNYHIGERSGGQYHHPGKIYCIRIYNRQLTAEEMLHNQQVDNARFNLGLSI